MALQQLDLTGPLEASTPIATIAAATRQRKTEELNQQEHALTLQRLSQQIQESKKKADDEKAITDIIKAGGEPQEVSKRLLEAGYPDASRTYLTNSQADVLQAQQQALLRAEKLQGQVAPEVTAAAPQAQMAPIQTSLTDQTQTAAPAAPAQPQTQQVPTPLPSVDVPFIGQPSTTIRPQSAQQLTLAERAKAEFNAGLEARKKASEPTIIPANASVLQNGVVTTPNPKQEPAEVKFSNDGIPYAVIGSDKVTRTIGDPNMPAADKKLADKAIADHAQAIKEKIDNEDRLNANATARAEAAARRQELRAAEKAGNDPRVKNVPEADRGKAYSAVLKAEDDLSAAKAAAGRMTTVLSLAKSGNKEAQASAALVGVQAINEMAGIKRVNQAEISAYGNAGSLIDSLEGRLGKIVAGKPIPDDILNDMQKLHDAFAANADTTYQRKIQGVDKTFRSTFAPAAAAPAATSGNKVVNFGDLPK